MEGRGSISELGWKGEGCWARMVMRLVMMMVVVVVKCKCFLADSKRTCVVGWRIGRAVCRYKGGSYAQILESGELLFGFQIGHGGGAIFDDAGGGNVQITSVKGVVDVY